MHRLMHPVHRSQAGAQLVGRALGRARLLAHRDLGVRRGPRGLHAVHRAGLRVGGPGLVAPRIRAAATLDRGLQLGEPPPTPPLPA